MWDPIQWLGLLSCFCDVTVLQAFSIRLFYNKDTGYFEQVHKDGMVCWDKNVTPTSSLTTLYLPEDTMGPVRVLSS